MIYSIKTSLLHIALLFAMAVSAQTTLTLQPGAASGCDATLGFHTNYNKDLNYGDQLHIKMFCMPGYSGGNNTCRGLISFDVSKIPAGATITSAELTLYACGKIADKLPGHYGNNAVTISRVTNRWTEFGVKWNTAPSYTGKNAVTLQRSTNPNQDYTCDVTAMVKEMAGAPSSNYGFYLALAKEDPASPSALLFCSSDHPDASKHPKLVIVYSMPQGKLAHAFPGDIVHQEKSQTPEQEKVKPTPVVKPEVKAVQDSVAGTLIINTGPLNNVVISIYAADGQFVRSIHFQGEHSSYAIPIGDLHPGSYTIEFVSDTERGKLKFVKPVKGE